MLGWVNQVFIKRNFQDEFFSKKNFLSILENTRLYYSYSIWTETGPELNVNKQFNYFKCIEMIN